MEKRIYGTIKRRPLWWWFVMVSIFISAELLIVWGHWAEKGVNALKPSDFPDLSHEVVWVEARVKLAVKVGRPDSVAMIAKQSHEAGLNPEKMLSIARCESKFDHLAINKDSSSRGLFQIIKSTQKEVEAKTGKKYDVFDPVENIEMAVWLYKKYGDKPWNASKGCWNK